MLRVHSLCGCARAWASSALTLWAAACSAAQPGPLDCHRSWICTDSDCDTLCNETEGSPDRDSDLDGTPDYLDLDTDGDGISDLEEAGDDDPRTAPYDRNRDGLADYLDPNYPLGAGRRREAGGGSGAAAATPPPPEQSLEPEPSAADAGSFVPICPNAVQSGCGELDLECNGLDDDCDGQIDEASPCSCRRGQVRRCFPGPPGRRNVGGCSDGRQVCVGDPGRWGPCEDHRSPQLEICDSLDNDCNGCADELADCQPLLACPTPLDPRTPPARPYEPYVLDAAQFYRGSDATGFRWWVQGAVCDRMFAALDPSATPESRTLSYTLDGADQAQARVLFSSSGSYPVLLRVSTSQGELWCSYTLHVRAPGLRVELCWDKTGPSAHAQSQAVDLDLHLAKAGVTKEFATPDDCYAQTCRGASAPWSYPGSPLAACSGESAQNHGTYASLGQCPNPRLDTDNRLDAESATRYLTETISLDAPAPGDRFRVMVHYKTNTTAASLDEDAGIGREVETHPLVNVYCDGELLGSFGGAPAQLGDPEEVDFSYPGQMWRVADIVSAGGTCTVSPLAAESGGSGYWVSGYEPSYGD